MAPEYLDKEDIATDAVLREDAALSALPCVCVRASGPGVYGCRRYGKAMMVSYIAPGELDVYDLFLDKKTALSFVASIDDVRARLSLRPLVLSYESAFDRVKKELLLDKKFLQLLFKDIDALRPELAAFEEEANAALPPPVRQTSMTEEEAADVKKTILSRVHFDPPCMKLENIDKGVLLALLYNNATTGGAGLLHDRPGVMIPAEGNHIFAELRRLGEAAHFDYLNGRSIKTWFDPIHRQDIVSVSGYWDYNYAPLAAMAALAARGIYTRPSGGEFDIYLNEARETCFSLNARAKEKSAQPKAAEVLKAVQEKLKDSVPDHVFRNWLDEQKRDYKEALRPENLNRFYQISLSGSQRGEVGPLVRPFSLRDSFRLLKGGPGIK